jgi:hypothetical protein
MYTVRMGKDFELVAYRGEALPDARIIELVQRYAPDVELLRHVPASAAREPIVDLHCVAFYERVAPVTSKSYFSESMIPRGEAGGSLASLVQHAWSQLRADVVARPKREPAIDRAADDDADVPADAELGPAAALARALSESCDDAFLVGYGDHSGIGIYARFVRGELVEPASLADIYADADDYVAAPARAWSQALGRTVAIDDVAGAYFHDGAMPALLAPDAAPVAFSADRFVMTLADD